MTTSTTRPAKKTDRARASVTAATDSDAQGQGRDLLATLFFELFQTERSAIAHPSREADRYGETPPAHALRAIASHAKRTLPEIEGLARSRDIRLTRAGKAVGEMLSVIRDAVVDRLVSSEKSYRGTLIGVRHGIDLVTLIASLAEELDDQELVRFTTRWMRERQPLVGVATEALSWFARHPDLAVRAHGKGVRASRKQAPKRAPRPALA